MFFVNLPYKINKSMALNNSNREDWQDVFEQAVALRDAAPWRFMEESELFGIKSLYSDEIGWCYFIGNSGEVFSLIIAIGDEGLSSYYNMRDPTMQYAGLGEQLFRFFNQRIIQVEFTNPAELEKQDRLLHKLLKIPTAGAFQHCKIREFIPGYPLALPKDKQLPFLADCLEQALEVALAYQKDEDYVCGPSEEAFMENILLRTCREQGEEDVVWEDSYVERAYPDHQIIVDTEGLPQLIETSLAGLERQKTKYFYFMRYMRATVNKDAKGGPAYRPIFAALLSPRSAYAHPPEMFHYKRLKSTFAKRFCRQLKELGYIPETLIVNTTFTATLIEPIADILNIELTYDPSAEEFHEFEHDFGSQF